MNLTDLNPPFVELPKNQTWHRTQRLKYRRDSVRVNGLVLPPAGTMTGRFDLKDEPTAYLADSALTSLYESLFRREAKDCSFERLKERGLATFTTNSPLRLVDLRGLEEQFPVLQSLRYEVTQAFAAECRAAGAEGILYASAQHAYHACVCVFPAGMVRMKRREQTPLVQPGTDRLHKSVSAAARAAAVPIVPS